MTRNKCRSDAQGASTGDRLRDANLVKYHKKRVFEKIIEVTYGSVFQRLAIGSVG